MSQPRYVQATCGPSLILHVDDEPGFLHALQRQLRTEPYQIISAPDAKTALVLARDICFDLVILDVAMPGHNGFELLKKLHAIDPTLPAIMLTGLVEDFILYRSVNSGCHCFLQKPCEKTWLTRNINRLLRHGRHKTIQRQTMLLS